MRLLALLALAGCVRQPPVPEVAPDGEGWIVFNQSYSFASVQSSSSTYSSGSAQVTVTTTTATSFKEMNQGSHRTSAEAPRCEGFGWVKDCPSLKAAK
jgi:hypothetical protein